MHWRDWCVLCRCMQGGPGVLANMAQAGSIIYRRASFRRALLSSEIVGITAMNSSVSSRFFNVAFAVLLSFCLSACGLLCAGCTADEGEPTEVTQINKDESEAAEPEPAPEPEPAVEEEPAAEEPDPVAASSDDEFGPEDIPEYEGDPYVEVEGNDPDFTAAETTDDAFEDYESLDGLGRCTEATACVGEETMPTEERGSISSVHPTGWHSVKYEWVEGKYLYNRCHLIGFQLTAENANERNLITGTRSMNVDGMLPFENEVADYVDSTGNHVMYRVTPIYADDDDLVALGVQMEAESVEDNGRGVCFNVFVYNIEPGVEIDYETGESAPDGTMSSLEKSTASSTSSSSNAGGKSQSASAACDYIANANSKKLHYPECSSVDQMSESNKVYLNCTRQQALNKGYDPCGRCNP